MIFVLLRIALYFLPAYSYKTLIIETKEFSRICFLKWAFCKAL